MICKDCLYQRNCINGSWCIERKIYVEYRVINQCEYYGKKKKVEVGAFIECHKTCAFSRGNTCKFWSTSHRELYKEIENEHDYEFFMANSKCTHYKRPKR